MPLIGRQTPRGSLATQTHRSTESTPKFSKNPLRIFLNPDIIVLLSISAVAFTVFYGFIAPFSILLEHSYPFLSETDIGLCFVSVGVGTIVGSMIMGKILDLEYARFKRSETAGANGDRAREELSSVNDRALPLEVVRTIYSSCGWHYLTLPIRLVSDSYPYLHWYWQLFVQPMVGVSRRKFP